MGIFKVIKEKEYDIGLWKTTESLEELKKAAHFLIDIEKLDTINNLNRKKQWLSVRLLFYNLLEKPYLISYNNNGKPFIPEMPCHISISHSNDFVAIIINKKEDTGIDIEKISPKIMRLTSKFLTSEEGMAVQQSSELLNYLHIYWGAKEALYKLYGKKGLFFSEHLFIEPFIVKNKGNIRGWIKKGNNKTVYNIKYEKIEEYMLVYVVNQIS